MAIEKLPEFAKNGQKDTDKLNQEDGFPVNLKPARQWFNYLFNKLSLTVNLLIDEDYLPRREIINNLTTKDAKKPLSAEMGVKLKDVITRSGLVDIDLNNHISSVGPILSTQDVSANGFYRVANSTVSMDTWPNQSSGDAMINAQWYKGYGFQLGSAKNINSLYFRTTDNSNYRGWVKVLGEVDVVNNLDASVINRPLSAAMGKKLNDEKLAKDDAFHDAFTSNPTYMSTGSTIYADCNELPTGEKLLIASNNSILNKPPIAGFFYIETLNSYRGSTFIQNAYGYSNTKRCTRCKGPSGWSEWETIAFEASNVASATKLKTPRKINGVDFDASKNIDLVEIITTTLDWNTLVKPRNYSVLATAGTNRPATNFGTLIVSGADGRCSQIFITDTSPPNTYIRICKDGVWGTWERLANVSSNVASATKLATIRTVKFTGAATGSFTYNGSANSSAVLTLANSGVTAGAYGAALKVPVLTVNAKGLITVVTEQAIPAYSGTTSIGLVPARVGSTTTKYLREDGGWITPPNTTFGLMTASEMQAGTATTARTINAIVLKDAILHWSPNYSADLDVLLYSPIPYSKTVAPSGFLVLMGQFISQATYPKLFERYGSLLPDMRGEFIRGLDGGRWVDSGRSILSWQHDELRAHKHFSILNAFSHGRDGTWSGEIHWSSGDVRTIQNVTNRDGLIDFSGGNETRPRNIAYLYIVKAG